jgi:MFS family permease
MCFKVREGDYPPPPPPGPAGAQFLPAAKTYFRDCFGNPYYLWFFGATTLSWMAFVPGNLFGVFYAKSLHMNTDTLGKCAAIMYTVSLLLSYFLGALADRFHPLRVGIAAMSLYALATLWASIFATDVKTLFFAIILQGVLAGAWMTGTAALGQMLLPKLKFAEFASASGIVGCIGTMIVGPIMGAILDHTGHDYRLIFVADCILAVLACLSSLRLYYKFIALGGPANYLPPGVYYG